MSNVKNIKTKRTCTKNKNAKHKSCKRAHKKAAKEMCQRTKERAATPKLQANPTARARTQTYRSLACRSATGLNLCYLNRPNSGRYVVLRPQGHPPAARASLRQASVHGTLLFGVPNRLLGTKGRLLGTKRVILTMLINM